MTAEELIKELQKVDPSMKVGRCRFTGSLFTKLVFDDLIEVEIPGPDFVSQFPRLAQSLIAFRHDIKWDKDLTQGEKATLLRDAVQPYFYKDASPDSLRVSSKHLGRLGMYVHGRNDHLKALYLKVSDIYLIAARELEG